MIDNCLSAGLQEPNKKLTMSNFISAGFLIHLFLLPYFAYRKANYKHLHKDDILENVEIDPEAKTVIFARSLSCCDKIAKFTFGMLIELVGFILKIIKEIGLDLRSFWVFMPFWEFYKAKLDLRAYQIDGCKLRFDARQEDAYLKFQYEAVMNFFTLSLYGMCCGKKINYERWLDSKIKWRGNPPPGYNNQFRIFKVKLSCCQKLKLGCMLIPFYICCGPFWLLSLIPFIGALVPTSLMGYYVDFKQYKMQLSNYRFGGSKPVFDKKKYRYCCKYLHAFYCLGCFGLCKKPFLRWLDSCVMMGDPVVDPSFDDDVPEDEPEVKPMAEKKDQEAPTPPAPTPGTSSSSVKVEMQPPKDEAQVSQQL